MTAETDLTQGCEVPQRLPGVPHNLGVDRRAAQELLHGEASSLAVPGPAAPAAPAAAAGPDAVAPDNAVLAAPGGQTAAPGDSVETGAAQPAAAPDTAAVVAPAESDATAERAAGRAAQQPQPTGFAERLAARLEERAAAAETHPAARQTGNRKPYRKDFTVTVLLLAVATFGALTLGQSLLFLPQQMHQMAAALPQHDLTVPAWVATAGQVGALALLTLYAVTLLFTISRLQARKLAFWAPLSAGLLALLLTMSLVVAALTATIPLVVLNDPSQMQILLEAINTKR